MYMVGLLVRQISSSVYVPQQSESNTGTTQWIKSSKRWSDNSNIFFINIWQNKIFLIGKYIFCDLIWEKKIFNNMVKDRMTPLVKLVKEKELLKFYSKYGKKTEWPLQTEWFPSNLNLPVILWFCEFGSIYLEIIRL